MPPVYVLLAGMAVIEQTGAFTSYPVTVLLTSNDVITNGRPDGLFGADTYNTPSTPRSSGVFIYCLKTGLSGLLKTGDVGTIDADGYMMITDRKKDLIKSGGEWISSIALELALIEHPKVKEACVIAIPDERWTERPLACIVFADHEKTSNAELRSFLETRFATYQVPELFVELKEIPKTSVGKMDKKELRILYANGQL